MNDINGRKSDKSARPIRAAQYVRMSTDRQKYSIDHQLAAIGIYADANDFHIVRTYVDAGRSGLDLRGRDGLQRLLSDVGTADRPFDALIVYDVSRWGRFQDTDEAAYYEQICKRAGVRVIYCAEPFENDGGSLSSVLKAMKRIMAAEYSRELSVRVAAGQYRAVQMGLHRGGKPGLGLSRVLLDETGKTRCVLEPGQAKHLKTDRVVLAPGLAKDVAVVRRIFRLFVVRGMNEEQVAEQLNHDGVPSAAGSIWRAPAVRKILRNERYIGTNVHGRESTRLKTPRRLNPPELWLRVPNAFVGIVPNDLFEAAQQKFRDRSARNSDDDLLALLRDLWDRKGRLSADLIKAEPGMPCVQTYYTRFGSLGVAYGLIGFKPKWAGLSFVRRADELFLGPLRQILREHGRLSRHLINAHPSAPGSWMYERHFGSLGYAYSLVGFKSRGGRAVEPSEWLRRQIEEPERDWPKQ